MRKLSKCGFCQQIVSTISTNSTLCRWVDICVLTSFVVIVGLFFQKQMLNAFDVLSLFFSNMEVFELYGVLLVVSSILTVLLVRIGAINAQFKISTMLRYPPCWFASILFICVFFLIKLKVVVDAPIAVDFEDIAMLSGGVSALSIGVIFGFLYHSLDIIKASPVSEESAANGAISKNSEGSDPALAIIEWFMEESPIVHPDQDTFHQRISTRRVSELLLSEQAVSIGIVGGYGTGKSSFINLVEYYLQSNSLDQIHLEASNIREEFIFCRVDGWGRVYGTVAKQILTEAIESVKPYVDCSAIISLPEQYQKAIAGTSSLGGAAISSLFQCSHNPESQLCRLNHILNAARIRLVIVLEDVDRNLDENIIREEIPALLDRLRMLGSISFIFSIGTEQHYSNIIARICNHVEAIS